MREEMRKVFVSEEDNRSFETQEECQKHIDGLNAIKDRLRNMKFYRVTHSPDLTEGRGYYGLTYIAIETKYDHENWFMDYCYTHFGKAIQMVQGCSPIAGWVFDYAIDVEEFLNWKEKVTSVGDYTYSAKAHFISNNGDYPEFPKAEIFECCHKLSEETKG